MKDKHPGQKKKQILFWLGLAAGVLGGLISWRRLAASRVLRWPDPGETPGTALVTGASSGLGMVFARRLAAAGYDLLLVARRQERLAALAAELQQHYSVRAEPLAADLAGPTGVARVETRLAELDDLSLVVNNAGFGLRGDLADSDPAKVAAMIYLHVIASVRLSRAALPGMIGRRRGAIINVSSVAGFMPIPGALTYGATKNYLIVFSETLQAELAGTGVRVQALCPGFTYTEFHQTPDYEGFERSQIPKFLWMSPEKVVDESLKALGQGRVICVPGLIYGLFAGVTYFPFIRWLLQWLLRLIRGRWFRGLLGKSLT